MKHKQYRRGFTIVELVVVIFVIAILAAITAAIFNNAQLQARDAKRRDAAVKVADAIGIYMANNKGAIPKGGVGSTVAISGQACADGADGFFAKGAYTCTIEDTLIASGLLPTGFSAALPPNDTFSAGASVNSSLAIEACANGQAFVMTSLEDPSADDLTNFNKALTACGLPTASYTPRDTWGMQAAVLVKY